MYVFGYGSLPDPRSGPSVGAGALATLRGWRRAWAVAMDNSRDLPGYKHYLGADGGRPDLFVAFLDIRRAAHTHVNGVAFAVSSADLAALDDRERNYERVEVGADIHPRLDAPVWAYVGRRAARERFRRGQSGGRLVIARSYHDAVRDGFARLGPGVLREFDRTTDPLPCALADLRLVRHDAVGAGPARG